MFKAIVFIVLLSYVSRISCDECEEDFECWCNKCSMTCLKINIEEEKELFEEGLKKIKELQKEHNNTLGISCTIFTNQKEKNNSIMISGVEINPDPQHVFNENDPSHKRAAVTLPATLDYRPQLNAVQWQQNCGDCYAFAAIGVIEGCLSIKNGTKVVLSKQQPTDCARVSPYNCNGCSGGQSDKVFNYAMMYGIQTESVYPFTGALGNCAYNGNNAPTNVIYQPTNYVTYSTGVSATTLMTALYNYGPLFTYIFVDSPMFNYVGGVYNSNTCQYPINHAVMIVGYNTVNGVDCWIVRNSWGDWWGDKGYMYLPRGVNKCYSETFLGTITGGIIKWT